MASEKETNGNGKTNFLLWANTVLTALILPLLAFVGVRLWDQVDGNAKSLNDAKVEQARSLAELKMEISKIQDRQNRVLEELPKLNKSVEDQKVALEEHKRMTEGMFQPARKTP